MLADYAVMDRTAEPYNLCVFLNTIQKTKTEATMTDANPKQCPKCNGTMSQGRILKYNEYLASNRYLYVFAPDGESGPDLAKVFSGKPLSKERKSLVAFCCEECGFVEFYGVLPN